MVRSSVFGRTRSPEPRVRVRRRLGLLGLPCVLLAAGLLGGCRASDATAEAEVTRSEFVEIVTALRQAERAVAQEESAESLYAERKSEILARYDVTESNLRAFVERLQEDPAELQAVWDTISQRLKHVPGEGDGLEVEGELEDGGEREPPSRGPPGEPAGDPRERPLPGDTDGREQTLH